MLLKCWGKHYWKMLYLHKMHFWWFDFLRTPWTLAVWWRRASRKKKINPSSFLTSSSSPWPLPLWCSLVIWWRPGKWLCGQLISDLYILEGSAKVWGNVEHQLFSPNDQYINHHSVHLSSYVEAEFTEQHIIGLTHFFPLLVCPFCLFPMLRNHKVL